MLTLRFSHTHLYPGATGRGDAAPSARPSAREADCLVEFADGVEVPGRLFVEADSLLLALRAYSTARGTAIAAKHWRLAPGGEDETRLRVIARAVDPG